MHPFSSLKFPCLFLLSAKQLTAAALVSTQEGEGSSVKAAADSEGPTARGVAWCGMRMSWQKTDQFLGEPGHSSSFVSIKSPIVTN